MQEVMHRATSFDALDRENLGDSVYARLSGSLIKGRFPPDARLTIRELAQSLGTSVTPVRDAILRLIQDEALVQRSAREVRVPIVTPARYREIRLIRLKLEGLAARESALKARPQDVDLLRDLISGNERAITEQNWSEALELNQAFHFALVEIADMTVLRGVLHRLWLQMGPLIAASYQAGGRVMIDHHYPVVAAIESKDPDAAERAIAEDIGEGGKLILARLAGRHGDEADRD